ATPANQIRRPGVRRVEHQPPESVTHEPSACDVISSRWTNMLPVSIGFVSAGLLLLIMGVLIRRGATWLIAGYDPSQVRDEKGLARWGGAGLLAAGGVEALAGGLVYVLPPGYALIPVILLFLSTAIGGVT